MKICLDAGHYGKYNQSPADPRYYESDVMWKLHLLLKKYLEEYGITVFTTREKQEKDRGLYDRGAASAGSDLFISIHSNAVGSNVNDRIDYPVSYCAINHSADTIGLILATVVEQVMETSQPARIEHLEGNRGDYYGVLRGATAVGTPALILEHSFHTNTAMTAWLLNDQNLERLASAEAEAIAEYYGISEPEPEMKSGWIEEQGGWRFYLGNTGTFIANNWYEYKEKWYWFDGDGKMVTNVWYLYKESWYYLGPDGAMIKGLVDVSGKWYYLDDNGEMATDPITLTPDQNGALKYPGLAS